MVRVTMSLECQTNLTCFWNFFRQIQIEICDSGGLIYYLNVDCIGWEQ